MKNKIVSGVASLVLLFGTAACSGDERAQPVPQVTVTATPEAPEEVFVKVIRDNTDDFDVETDATLISLANSMCDAWDSNVSFSEVASLFLENGYSVKDAGFFIGAGTEVFCPEHNGKFETGSTT